jgi:hypothetical protein
MAQTLKILPDIVAKPGPCVDQVARKVNKIVSVFWRYHNQVCVQYPGTGSASCAPGQGGMVAISRCNASAPVVRNWKCVPTGMVTHIPGARSVICASSGLRRHTWPAPATQYQISSTVWWMTAFETVPAGSVQ